MDQKERAMAAAERKWNMTGETWHVVYDSRFLLFVATQEPGDRKIYCTYEA